MKGFKDGVRSIRQAHETLMQRPLWGRRLGYGLVCLVVAALIATLVIVTRIVGGGDIRYEAKGSPGRVVFHHWTHRSGTTLEGKAFRYECKECHEKLYAAEKYGTFILRFLRSSDRVARTGRDTLAVFVPPPAEAGDVEWPTVQVERACVSCGTGKCHNGTDAFSRFECLKCHNRR